MSREPSEGRLVAGRYRLIERLGGGAMGVVWQAQDRVLDRVVAVKELLLASGLSEAKAREARNRAMREGRIAARLQHPHAVTVFDVVEDGDRPWLVMEFLPSRSLAEVLSERGPLSPEEVARIGCELASALVAAHRAGVVHRDVKPGNVLFGDNGTIKLTDFGISRATGDTTVTATGEVAGTPAFFAPEVARGESAGFPSDVFSLGATLYNAVEGQPPFGLGDNAIALLHRVSCGRIIPPGRAGSLTPVLLSLLVTDPVDRPDAAAALHALIAVRDRTVPEVTPVAEHETAAGTGEKAEVSGTPGTAAAPESRPLPARRSSRHRWVAVAALLVFAAAITTIVLMTRSGGGQASPPAASSAAPPATTPAPASDRPPTSGAAATGPEVLTRALTDYYALLPGDLTEGYARLSARFKQDHGQTFANYSAFWLRFGSVTLSDATATGGDTVSAEVTYHYAGGGSTSEHDVFTLVRENGVWLIDTERVG